MSERGIEEYRKSRYEAYNTFNALNSSAGLGDWGSYAHLGRDRKEEEDEVFEKEKFNKILSDLISLDRRLLDYRVPQLVALVLFLLLLCCCCFVVVVALLLLFSCCCCCHVVVVCLFCCFDFVFYLCFSLKKYF